VRTAPDLDRIRLLLFDVDGVFTDNGLYVQADGTMAKRFDIRDGAGVKLAQMAGYEVGLISGHDSNAVRKRAAQLGIELCYTGVKDKRPVFSEVLTLRGAAPEDALYMGDDYFDLPLLARAGLAVTVPEAPSLVREHCHWISGRAGGRGAVRDTVERLLRHTGKLDAIQAHFLGDEAPSTS
jgi:3-deoxy-D-manno-octulosonate 8-phosphate phosphatase (KDO 8-P phosphatase)